MDHLNLVIEKTISHYHRSSRPIETVTLLEVAMILYRAGRNFVIHAEANPFTGHTPVGVTLFSRYVSARTNPDFPNSNIFLCVVIGCVKTASTCTEIRF